MPLLDADFSVKVKTKKTVKQPSQKRRENCLTYNKYMTICVRL